MKMYPNILLVAGQGRNVGKTFLIENIIRQFKDRGIIAIKVSPHFHELPLGARVLSNSPDFQIVEERDPDTGKDSSRFLKAGAEQVFYLQVLDEHLELALAETLALIEENRPLVIESGGMIKILNPGLFLFVESSKSTMKNKHLRLQADKVLQLQNEEFHFDYNRILWDGRSWKLKEK